MDVLCWICGGRYDSEESPSGGSRCPLCQEIESSSLQREERRVIQEKMKAYIGAPVVSIFKDFKFEASHVLLWHQGKCRRLHGHSYTLRVGLKGLLSHNGVVKDFASLSTTVEALLERHVDHRHLNNFIGNPTAENICFWFWKALQEDLPELDSLQLWETATSSALLKKEDFVIPKETL